MMFLRLHLMLLWILVASLTVLVTGGLLNSSSSSPLVIDASASVVRVGDSVQLRCTLPQSLQTTPNVHTTEDITWRRVNEDETLKPVGVTVVVNGSSSDITLVNVSVTDSGVYRCCLADTCVESADIRIRVGLPPTPATNLTCYSFNFEQATCEWVKGGQLSHLESTDLLQLKDPSAVQTEWEKCSYQMPDDVCLSNDCQQQCKGTFGAWEYRINTTNALGSVYSESVIFYAERESKLHPPQNVTVRNESATALIVTWYLPKELKSHLRHQLKYNLEYRWEGSTTWFKKDIDVKITGELSNLNHPYGLYYIRVQAIYDTLAQSDYSQQVEARTSEKVPVDNPEEIYCEDQPNDEDDSRQILLGWKAAPNEFKRNGEILGYVISYKTSDDSEAVILDTKANDTSWTVKDLKQGLHYIFSMQTRNSMGLSGKKRACTINPILKPVHLWDVIGGCLGIVALLILVTIIWFRVKASLRKFPDINMPVHHTVPMDCGHVNQVLMRETEVFDDPIQCQLFVSLDPKENNREAIFTDIITDGFDIGDKPRVAVGFQDAFESHPLLGLTVNLTVEEDGPMAAAPLLPSSRREEDPSSGEEYGGMSPSSPLSIGSVGSGGSYLHIRDDEEVVYSRMTRDGLSPVETQDIEGQRVRGERSMDFPTGVHVDGLPQLHWRPESVSEDPGDVQGGDLDHSTNPSRPTVPSGARGSSGPGSIGKDDQRFKPPSGQKKPKQPPPLETPPQEDSGNLAGASYVGDGSIASYVRQGFLPDPSPTDLGESDDQASAPIGSYCQVGAQGEISFDAPRGSYLVSSPGPTSPINIPLLDQAANGETSADNQDEDGSSEDEIVSYVLSAGTLPSTRPSQSTSQIARDSSLNHPSGSQGAEGSVSEPVSQASNPRNILNAFISDGDLSSASFSEDEDEVQGGDSNIHRRDGRNETEQDDMSGYVTQGMIPNGLTSPASRRTNTGIAPIPSAAESGYVDQEQLAHITSPPAIPSPAQPTSHGRQNDVMVGDYVTQGQDLGNRPTWLSANSADESPINYNNNNSRMLDSILQLPVEPEEYVPNRDNVKVNQVSEVSSSSENASCDEESGGRDSPNAAGTLGFGLLDHVQPPAYLNETAFDAVHVNGAQAEASNGINGYHVDQDMTGDGYVSHEQMLNMAADGSAKSASAHHERQDD